MQLLCPHFKQSCSGCSLQETAKAPPIMEEASLFFKNLFNYNLNLSVGSVTGWRTRAKLAVRGDVNFPIIGLFKEGTHEAVDIPNCQVQHPLLNQVVSLVKVWMIEEKIVPYNELTGKGQIRYIQLTLERQSGLVQLVLVLNQYKLDDRLKESIDKLWEKQIPLHSIFANFNQKKTNTIFGPHWEKLNGKDWLVEQLQKRSFYFHPASFIQANLEQYDLLLSDIVAEILPDKRVVEFYAGIGVIGLSTLEKSAHVTMSEFNKEGATCFEESRLRLSLEEQSKIEYLQLDARKGAPLLNKAEVVIVDPPRKGVEPALMEKIIKLETLEQLIWVSCGWNSFKKEAEVLKTNGFKLDFAKGFLFFPGTNHLEILAIFSKETAK